MHDARHVDAPLCERVHHETPKLVLTHLADKGHPQPQARRPTGKDGGRAADGEDGVIDQLFDLAEGRRHVAQQNKVGVDFADHDDVKVLLHLGFSF